MIIINTINQQPLNCNNLHEYIQKDCKKTVFLNTSCAIPDAPADPSPATKNNTGDKSKKKIMRLE